MQKFCGKCGAELEGDSFFCSECGAKIECDKEIINKKDKTKVKKIMWSAIVIISIFAVAFIGIKVFSFVQSVPSEKEIQMSANNLQNGAGVASDGEWLYYCGDGLCKMRLKDGNSQSVIVSDAYPQHMYYVGNNLFYFDSLKYHKLNGNSVEDLPFSVFSENCMQCDGKNYYVTGLGNYDESGIYVTELDNTEKFTKISDISPTRLLLQGEYLYAISGFGSVNHLSNENYGTWRMDKDGKNPILVLNYCPDYLVFSGDKLYYTNEENTICSANLDGSNEIIFEGTVTKKGLNVSDDYIFYIDNDTKRICRMEKDGSNKEEINNSQSEYLQIINDWILYNNEDCYSMLYKMSFDGSNNQPIYTNK